MRATCEAFARRLGRLWRSERGTQLVELALVLPILLTFFAATAEFGRYFHSYSTLAKATRAGARFLATTPVKAGGANAAEDAKARRLVVYGDANAADGTKPLVPGLSVNNVEIQRSGKVASVPDTVTVRVVGYTYAPLFDLAKFSRGLKWAAVPLKPSTTMRYLLTQPSSGS